MYSRIIALTAALAIAQIAAATNQKPQTMTPSERAVQSSAVSLSKSQAKAAGLIAIVENFEKIDANADGVVTRNELRAYALATRRYVPMT